MGYETHEFLAPDYYTDFSCKMGACRAPCCTGWPISLSIRDYYRMLSLPCPESLRRTLDTSLHLTEHPTEDEYANILPNWRGDCPLHAEDGKCMLHAHCGADALAPVCRLYPRGHRSEGDYECSCANSCEGVLEMLFAHPEPIRFSKQTLCLEMPNESKRSIYFETVGREQDIRMYMIRVLQERSLTLPHRLSSLHLVMQAFDAALKKRDAKTVDALLQKDKDGYILPPEPVAPETMDHALLLADHFLSAVANTSSSISRFGPMAINGLKDYASARAHFEQLIPDSEIRMENMLVNHMFFSRFPFQDRPEGLEEEYIALTSVYMLLRMLGIGCMADTEDTTVFTDACAAAFRLIQHSSYDRYAIRIMKKLNAVEPSVISGLLSL